MIGRSNRLILERSPFLMRNPAAEIHNSLNQPRLALKEPQLSILTETPRFSAPKREESQATTLPRSHPNDDQYPCSFDIGASKSFGYRLLRVSHCRRAPFAATVAC